MREENSSTKTRLKLGKAVRTVIFFDCFIYLESLRHGQTILIQIASVRNHSAPKVFSRNEDEFFDASYMPIL